MNNNIKELSTPMGSCVNSNSFDLIEEDIDIDQWFANIEEDIDVDQWFASIEEDVEDVEDRQYNDTEMWLFDAKSVNFERVRKYILTRAPHSHRWSQPACDVESYFTDFLYDKDTGLITKNQLKKELDKGEKIKDSVVYEWFLQFCVRDKYKSAQDCQNRALGAKTQAESDKVKAYAEGKTKVRYRHQHDIKKMDHSGYRIANLVVKKDKDTGDTLGEPEIVLNDLDSVGASFELQSTNDHFKVLCVEKWGFVKGMHMYQLYLDLTQEKYTSRKVWAKALKISYKALVTNIEKVQSLFKANLTQLGY